MAIKFQYNKTSKQQLEKQLKMRVRTLPIIKNKETALRLEVKKSKGEAEELQRKLDSQIAGYESMYALWGEFDPSLVELKDVELNVKNVVFTDDMAGFASYNFKPQLKTLGPKYGKNLGEIKNALAEISAGNSGEAMAQLNSTGVMRLNISIGEIELTKDDLLIEAQQKEEYCTVFDGGITVALDTVLTPELIEEGFVREIVSKIQNMRKDSGFEVMDHINVKLAGNAKLIEIVNKNSASIAGDVLADSITEGEFANSKEWNINGEDVKIGVKKV